MSEWTPPVLGLTSPAPDGQVRVVWRNGRDICGGILGAVYDPEAKARWDAEQTHKQQLRDQNVVVLADYKQGDNNA